MKRILAIFLCLMLLLGGCSFKPQKERTLIVAANFPAYDFARAVAGDCAEIVLLIPPGSDAHSFEPSPSDMRDIKNADIFIYTGGESDSWLDDIIKDEDETRINVNMMLSSGAVPHFDKIVDGGHHHDHEYDEHVWLDPDKAVLILKNICLCLKNIDPDNAELYQKNCEDYCSAITAEAILTKEIVRNSTHRTLCVADRFPYKHLCDYYALSYVSAFTACDSFADADAETVIKLIERVRERGLSYVFYNNNGSGMLADLVCAETGAEKLQLHSVESITKEEFDRGVTYLDIIKQNRLALERGLG